jgi:hypothetical protein
MDMMLLLQEETAKLQLGVQSKIGVLRAMGEEQPEIKMQEVFEEQVEDLKNEGALAIMRAQIQLSATILGGGIEPAPGPNADGTPQEPQNPMQALAGSDPAILGAQGDVQAALLRELVSKTFGAAPNRSST